MFLHGHRAGSADVSGRPVRDKCDLGVDELIHGHRAGSDRAARTGQSDVQ